MESDISKVHDEITEVLVSCERWKLRWKTEECTEAGKACQQTVSEQRNHQKSLNPT